uniref:F-box domain-containing protein n=1 Tax=Parastrongyloides trichosuri TaxID=131310 RepID=A0A0N5A7B8_PARTI
MNEQLKLFDLPDLVLTKVLSYLKYNELTTVRKVSRFFNYFIDVNNHLLDRPRVEIMEIKSVEVDDGESNVTQLKLGGYELLGLFDQLKKSIGSGINVGELNISLYDCNEMESFKSFISKISSVKKLFISRLCFNQTMLNEDYMLPKWNNLNRMTFDECTCLNYLNRRNLKKFLENYPKLMYTKLVIPRKMFDYQLIDIILKNQNICRNNKVSPFCQEFLFQYYVADDFDVEEALEMIQSNEAYKWTLLPMNTGVGIHGRRHCNHCKGNIKFLLILYTVWDTISLHHPLP